MPYFTTGGGVLLIDRPRGQRVQFAEHSSQITRISGRGGDEVVVIRKHSPCLKAPAVLCGDEMELIVKQIQALFVSKEMSLFVRACRNHVDAAFEQHVQRCVVPRTSSRFHEGGFARFRGSGKSAACILVRLAKIKEGRAVEPARRKRRQAAALHKKAPGLSATALGSESVE